VAVRITSSQIGTWLVVTVVALLIWFWAAGETRKEDTVSFRVDLVPPETREWVVSPSFFDASVTVLGSPLALRKARELGAVELHLGNELPATPGALTANVAALLASHHPLRRTGVSVLSAQPVTVDITVDRLVAVTAAIKPILPNLQTAGDVTVTPTQATVRLPLRLRDVAGDDLTLEAVVDQARLDQVEPGRFYSLAAKLRLPQSLADNSIPFEIDPPLATVEFTVRSRIEQVTLPQVLVQIAGPWQDHEEYIVEVDERDKQVQDVTIKADGDLIKRIAANDVPVVALVHLTNKDKEQRIESKPVTCFLAILPDGPVTLVEAEIADSPGPPVIRLNITPRAKE
jgi:hypothetical protein